MKFLKGLEVSGGFSTGKILHRDLLRKKFFEGEFFTVEVFEWRGGFPGKNSMERRDFRHDLKKIGN